METKKKGRPPKRIVDDVILSRMINIENKTNKECADFFGVSENSIKYARKRINKVLTKPPAIVGDELHGESISSMRQLVDLNARILQQLNRNDDMIKREEVKMAAVDALMERYFDKDSNNIDAQEVFDKIWNNNTKNVLLIQSNITNSSAEIRKQIELQLKIAEALYNMQTMAEFQTELIDILKNVDPVVAHTFVARLKERRALRGIVNSK
jgi:hypothetical protein